MRTTIRTRGPALGLAALAAAPLLASGTPPESEVLAPAPARVDIDGGDVGDRRPLVVTPEQRQAVERGLAWLAAEQHADGSWRSKVGYKLNNGYEYTADRGHVGVTALACMAFLAGGHLPARGEYGDVVERGLDFVLGCCQDDGYITGGGTRMYSHAFATLFLAEIYGMTHREDVREKLQKAVDFIVSSQNEMGGWRYEPFAPESDMSIVVCQVLALRAARNIGIRVPKATVDNAARYVVDSAIVADDAGHRFNMPRYQSDIGAFRYQKGSSSRSSFPLTAAGVTALNGVGIYSDEAIEEGLQYLNRHLDSFNYQYGRHYGGHYFFWYGHYYGVQAMYTAGGSYWEPYFTKLRDELIAMQHPSGHFPNQVGPGKPFGTAMAVLILEIPYRFLPIFQR